MPQARATGGSDISFARTYGGPAAGFIATSVRPTTDGGFIIAGLTSSSSRQLQTWLLKLDGTGAVLWQKEYTTCGICSTFAVVCTSPLACGTTVIITTLPQVVQTPDGGFVVESNTNASSTTIAFSVFKVDSNGSLVWQRAFTGVGNATASSVDLTSDGGIVVVGSTALRNFPLIPPATGVFLARPSTLVLKLDSTGDLMWQKTYSGLGSASPASVRQTSDGGFVVAGSTGVAGGNAWILRLDSGGSIVWQKTYLGGGSSLLSAKQISDGGFIATGITNTTFTPPIATFGGALVLRLDSTGAPIWQKSYGGANTLASSIQQTSDGGFIVAGVIGLVSGGTGTVSSFSALVFRLDGMGGIVWQRTFGPAFALSVQQTSDGGFVAAGIGGVSTIGALVIRLDAAGEINSCPMLSTLNLAVSSIPINATSVTSAAVIISTAPLTTAFTSTETAATTIVLCPAVSQISVSVFFTDSNLNRLSLDSMGNPVVNVTLAGGEVKSTNPGQVLAWLNVTNTSGSPVQSLKLNETLPVDWSVSPAWNPPKGSAGAIHVFYANSTSLANETDITQPSTITVSTGNPEMVHVAIPSLNATGIGHPLMPGQSILLSVKLSYGLVKTTQSSNSYPRNYTDTAIATVWTQVSFSGTAFVGSGSAFFIADAKVVG